MTDLQEKDSYDQRVSKYTREHFLNYFDALHGRREFEKLTIECFPERVTPNKTQRSRPKAVDINNDSDASVEGEEFREIGDVAPPTENETEDEGSIHTNITYDEEL